MSSAQFSHSADYTYLDIALRSRWAPFTALAEEMAAFVPRPVSDYADYRAAEIARLRPLNADKSEESLAYFVDHQISLSALPDMQFHSRFNERFMTEYVTVALLSHALCEAVINATLAIGLAHAGSAELFSVLERAEVKEKWQVGPKTFSPSYDFPVGTALHETLIYLTRQRNALVHYKIELEMDGTKILDGSRFSRRPFNEEVRWVRRFFSLPYDLATYAQQTVSNVPLLFFFDRKPIEPAPEHALAP